VRPIPFRSRRFGLLAVSVALVGTLVAPAAVAAPSAVAEVASTFGFRKAVTLDGIRAHQAALQAIADANDGTRLAGTPGYDASAEYVADMLEAAGYDVSIQSFSFQLVSDGTPPVVQQTAPASVTYVDGVDYRTMSYSGSGDVTAPVSAPAGPLGCDAADWAGFPAGNIALVVRGVCTFRIKATNAVAAGAAAVMVYNNIPGLLAGTLAEPLFTHPVIGLTQSLGQELTLTPGLVMRIRTDTVAEDRETVNVIAETAGGDPNAVVVVGAHLDSVATGPGINDNGSGSAAILEIAETLAGQQRDVRNKVRFMWFGAEEHGLIGSNRYVASLSQAERDRISLMLNFDMIGSPNFVRFVYDGDNSAFPVGPGAADGPEGSGEIERVFHDYFAAVGLPSAETPFSGRSDYGPFITAEVGIPAGGLFTGAEGIKTAQEAAIFGGTAGVAYDPCYHLACDTYANNSDTGLDQMSDAVAHVVLTFSKRNFGKYPLIDPVAATSGSASAGGGGGLHDHADEWVAR
jgi:Zn-dependent M28 family amino/carboxypeptidase